MILFLFNLRNNIILIGIQCDKLFIDLGKYFFRFLHLEKRLKLAYMNDTTKIRIEPPCPMMLSKMKTENGYYCNSCSKKIVDFRGKTEVEIKNKLEEGQCGIYDKQTVSTPTFGFKYQFLFKTLALLSLIGFNVKPLQAQEIPKKNEPLKLSKDTILEPVVGRITIDPKRDTILNTNTKSIKSKRKWFKKKKKKKNKI